jgi:hypothetical protein
MVRFGLKEGAMCGVPFDDHFGGGEFDLEPAGGLADGVRLLLHEEDEFLSFLGQDRRYGETDAGIATRFARWGCLLDHRKYNYLNI